MEFIKLVERGDLAGVRTMVGKAPINFQDEQGRTALECAIVCGHSDTVQLLLTAGADANLENPLTGQSPLVCAAVHRRYQEMKLLQHHGAQINRPGSKDGCTAMHVICKLGDADGFSTLIIKGARVTSIDNELRTPLHYAVPSGNITLIALLLQWGANPAALDKKGNVALDTKSPLYTAAQKLHVNRARSRGDGAYLEVTCPPAPHLEGLYEEINADHFQHRSSDHTLVRNSLDNMWCFTDGTRFVAKALDAAADPAAVLNWSATLSGASGMTRCPALRIRKPAVQSAGCDECKAYPIIGAGYFCTGRHDYDLCGACEGKSIQPFPTVKYYVNSQRPGRFTLTCHSAPSDVASNPTFHFNPKFAHTGITCSVCRVSPIIGARFKCLVRTDYDICSTCEAAAVVEGNLPHSMLKLYDPKHHPASVVYSARGLGSTHSHTCAVLPHMLSPEAAGAHAGEDCEFDPVFTAPGESKPFAAAAEMSITQVEARPGFTVTCTSVPALNGTYVEDYDDHYIDRDGGPNVLLKHPMDSVWCISNGNYFLAMAEDRADTAAAVKEWKCFIGRGLRKCADMSVAST